MQKRQVVVTVMPDGTVVITVEPP